MMEVKPVVIEGRTMIGVTVELPKTTLIAVQTDRAILKITNVCVCI
ncbi:hypothetical protein [Paenibacillus sp. GYB003]